jgi:hypothetical protein
MSDIWQRDAEKYGNRPTYWPFPSWKEFYKARKKYLTEFLWVEQEGQDDR